MRFRTWFTVLLLAGFVPVTTTACFGTFPIARKVYGWNATVHGNKWVRWGIFLGLNIVPVYAGAAIFDMVFSNSVEFWTGRNPMAAVPGTTRHLASADGDRATLVVREDLAIDVTIMSPGKPDAHFVLRREADAVAAFDADGNLIARAN